MFIVIKIYICINCENVFIKIDIRFKCIFKDVVYYKEFENNFFLEMVYFLDLIV